MLDFMPPFFGDFFHYLTYKENENKLNFSSDFCEDLKVEKILIFFIFLSDFFN